MHGYLRQLFCLSLFILLTACTAMPAKQVPINKPMTWSDRQATLLALKNWAIRGAIGVRSSEEGWSASMNWQQLGQNYVMRLVGPIGAGKVKLQGTPQQVTMTNAKNESFSAPTAEALLQQQTGWRLPISNLYYWVRGVPAPGVSAQKRFDKFHHLTELRQQNWRIEYRRYTSVNGIDLPSKIFLNSPNLRVRIVISNWDT